MMEYKGYVAGVEFDDVAGVFHGEVVNTRDVITFQGESVVELRREFEKSVDVYLDFCARHGKDPDKPLSGKVMLRLPPEMHRKAYLAAKRAGKSLNAWLAEQIERAALRLFHIDRNTEGEETACSSPFLWETIAKGPPISSHSFPFGRLLAPSLATLHPARRR